MGNAQRSLYEQLGRAYDSRRWLARYQTEIFRTTESYNTEYSPWLGKWSRGIGCFTSGKITNFLLFQLGFRLGGGQLWLKLVLLIFWPLFLPFWCTTSFRYFAFSELEPNFVDSCQDSCGTGVLVLAVQSLWSENSTRLWLRRTSMQGAYWMLHE